MEDSVSPDGRISSALLERLEAVAVAERRPAGDVLREAIEGYSDRRTRAGHMQLTPQEAGARIRDLRKGNVLPEGETIESLIHFGRT